MALDGMMLSLLCAELREKLIGARVDKIYQPVREELILALRTTQGSYRLLLSARAASPRIQLTELAVENPKQPPMLCMLLRKNLGSARLSAIRQLGFERAAYFDFDTTNELGDPIVVTLAAEIMGRYSNLIFIGADGRIIDSVKRIGMEQSSVRQVLPGLTYAVPPLLERFAVTDGAEPILDALRASPRDLELAKLLQETLEGASPLLCREIQHRACNGTSPLRSRLSSEQFSRLRGELEALEARLDLQEITPTMVLTLTGEPKDFSFIPIEQYGDAMQTRTYPNLSALLDAFYGERDAVDHMKQRMSDFSRLITARIERIERKLCAQKEDLLACQNRDALRISGDLLSANLHVMKKGASEITVDNFYDPDGAPMTIALDPRLTPVQNAQRYYREYRKADTAERMLHQLIEEGQKELDYLDTVYDLMTRARSEAELSAIRAELVQGGYLRAAPGARRRQEEKLAPLRYRSSDGFFILSGRNNLQNDRLTLKDSHNGDVWFHVQKIAGSHTVVQTQGAEVPSQTLQEAAMIAAVNSQARHSSKVPVDYTLIKNVKKQPGGRPGMVIYENYRTAIVDPDEELAARLRVD